MAVNKATQDNLTAWKKKLLSKGGYTVPEYDDDEQLAKRNDYESVHRLMVNRGQVEEWGERKKRDVSSYAFSTKNAKGVKPFSASQRVEAPVFNAGNLPDSFIGPRMQDSGSISRTEKNSPTKSSAILDFWGNSKFGSAALSAKGGSGTGLDAFGKADVTAVTGKQQAMYPDLGAKSQEEQEQEAREAAFSLLMDSQKPKTDALGQPVEQDSFRITDTLAPVAENKPASSEILTGEPMTPEQIAANKEQKENVPLRYRVGAAGRAAQNSVYNYADNLVSTLEGLHTGTDRGIDVYGEQHAALSDSFNNIAQRAQRDLEEGYISPITAQIIDTGTRMLIDTAIILAGGAAFGRASAAMSSNSVANQVLKTIQSPIFYTSLAQEFGSSYQEYIDNGVDKAEARVVSAGISALNAFIEAQGGTEEMISGTVSKILNKAPFGKGTEAVQEFVTNAMEEALEEMIQAPVSNLGAKATYDPERQVFNTEEMLGNAGTAFVSSLLLGGVATGTHVLTSKAVNSVSRAADNASIGKQVKETDGALDTLAKAAGRSEDTDVQQNLRKVYTQVSEGAEPSAQAVGELVRAMQQDQTVSYQQVLEDISRSSGKAADPGTQQNTGSFVQEYSRSLGENGSKAFQTIAEKVSAEELPQLKNAFQAYYNYGQWGKDFGNVDTSFRSFIDEAGAYAAYSAGRNDAEATVARAQARLQSAENGTQAKAGSKPGLAANLASRAVSAAERSYLDQIGRAFNVSIEMYTADTATEGNGYTAGGKIYLNTNSTNKLAGVINHELTHIMQERSPKAYQQYRDLVAAYVDRQERGWFDSQVERMIDGYAKRGQQITREEAVDEVVADASERFLSDEEAINTLVKENRSVARKVLDALREIIRKLSELVHGEGFDTRAAEVLSRDMEVYREAERLWVRALSESSEARTVNENETRYQLTEDDSSVDKRMVRFINRTIAGEFEGKNWNFTISKVSEKAAEIKKATGIDTNGFEHRMKTGSLKHILKRHGENGVHDQSMANAADIAQIPFVLENYDKVEPVLNTAGKQVTSHDFKLANGDHAPLIKYTLHSNDRFVYVVEAVTDGKANVVWVTDAYAQPIKKEGGQVLDAANATLSSESSETMLDSYNRPSSTFSISEFGEEVKEQNLDRKRTDSWLVARRLQLPVGLTNYGSIRNVTYSGEDVKEQNLNKKRNGSLSMAAAPQGSRQSLNTQSVRGISPAVSSTNIISETGEEVKEFSEGKKFQLVDYDERQKENWKNSKNIVLYESQEQFSDFIDGALSGSITGKKMYFGIVPKDLARKIKDVVDIETAGYNITLRSDEIRKIIKDHGNARKEAFRGQRGITKEDLLSIPNIIQSPDAIEYGGIYEGKPAIQFRKTIHGRTVVVTYVSRKHMDITVQTMYGGTKIESLATAADEQASANTPEALRGTTLNTYSIPQEQQLFNPENSEEKKFQFSGDEFDWLDDGDMDEDSAGYEWLDEQIDGAISGDDDGTITAQLAAVRAETKALEGNRLDEQQVNRVVKEVLRSYSSKYSAEKMAEVVNDALSAIRSRGNAGFAESVAAVYARAKAAVEASERLDKSLWDAEDVKSIRHTIRGTRMYVSEKERGDFKDGYNNYRRETFGTFKLTGDPADMSVDQVYTELSADYPGYFDGEAVSAHEQLEAMRDFLTAVRPTYTKEFEGNVEETALDMTAELLHQASVAAQERNVSEAVQADRSRQAKKYADNKKKLREKYTAKYKAGIQAEREKGAQRAASAKEQYQRKLTQQKEKYEARSERQKAGYEKREAEWKEQKQRLRDQSAGYRERIKTIREHNKQSRKAATDRRITTQIRHQIEKVVMNLGKELEHPTDTKHVPVELRGTVAAFLNTLDLSAQQDGLAVSPFKETQRQAAWRKLRDTCEKIIDEEAGDSESWYIVVDPDIVSRIDDLLSSGAIYHLNELNREQAEELYKLVRAVDHMVRYTDKVRLEGQMVSATETARGIIEDLDARGKEARETGKVRDKLDSFLKWEMMDPVRFADRMGETFSKVYGELRDGFESRVYMEKEAADYAEQLKEACGMDKKKLWKMEQADQQVVVGNRQVLMSKMQIMSLYLTNKREQGRKHLYSGGFSLPKTEIKGGKTITHYIEYHVTEADVEAIVGKLSDNERKFADGLQKFLGQNASEWGNRASLELYGYKKFTEKEYWPLYSDSNFVKNSKSLDEKKAESASIKNSGFTKALNENASNPVEIRSAMDVFSSHATQMAVYSAYVVPLENMNKVVNWQTRHGGDWRSVRKSMKMAYGVKAENYLSLLLQEINGEKLNAKKKGKLSKATGYAKAAAIGGNLRVVAQQPTSYSRALDVVPAKYLFRALAPNKEIVSKKTVEEMYNIVPTARWKNWGFGGDGFQGSSLKELIMGKEKWNDRFADRMMTLAGKADDMTWRALYRAAVYWSEGEAGTKRGTEEWRQDVRKKFNEIVDRTQVYDSTFKHGQIFKTGTDIDDVFTAFMKEPVTNYNIMAGHIDQYSIAFSTYLAAKKAGNTAEAKAAKQKMKQEAKGILRGGIGIAVSVLLAAAFTLPIDLARDKDDDETIQEKVMQALFGESIGETLRGDKVGADKVMAVISAALDGSLLDNINPIGWIPYLAAVQDVIDGYDPEIMGVGALNDVRVAGVNLWNSLSGKEQKYTASYYAYSFIRKLSVFSGIPVGNITRAVESGINVTLTGFEQITGIRTSKMRFNLAKVYHNPKNATGQAAYVQMMYDAERDGQNGLAQEIGNYLIEKGGLTYKQVQSKVLSLIKEDEESADLIVGYADAYMNYDYDKMEEIGEEAARRGMSPLHIQNAAKTLISSDKSELTDRYAEAAQQGDEEAMAQILQEAQDSGLSASDIVEAAMEDIAEAEKRFDAENLYGDAELSNSYQYNALVSALLAGDEKGVQDATEGLLAAGKTQKEIDSGAKSGLKTGMAKAMGYDSITAMEEAGKEFDTSDPAYKILVNRYKWSQYSFSDAGQAMLDGNSSRYNSIISELKRTKYPDLTQEEIDSKVATEIRKLMRESMGYESAEEMEEAGAEFGTSSAAYQMLVSRYKWSQYSFKDAGQAVLDGDISRYSSIIAELKKTGDSDLTQEDIDSKVTGEIRKIMREEMGYESAEEMKEAGVYFDTNSSGYRILHDRYGYTQYSTSDLTAAALKGDWSSYDRMVRDMVGQKSSGDNVYDEEGITENVLKALQKEFNQIYDDGKGNGWEQYKKAMTDSRLGKSWDKIYKGYRSAQARKEDD